MSMIETGSIDRLPTLRRLYGDLDGLALLRAVLRDKAIAGRLALVSSFGTESVVLLDMVASLDPALPVIFLDTGKLFQATHDYRLQLIRVLGLKDVRTARPGSTSLARVDPDGELWRRDPDGCCDVRKTEPLDQALEGFSAWITGRKRFQGGARVDLPTIEGEALSGRIKLNPLARWSSEDLEHYRRLRDLPPHPLMVHGYRSVGCVPCTRPVTSDEPVRAGRWWGMDKTECGIHRAGV